MRKLIFREFGEPSEVLSLEDVPAPAPGAGEVRVRLTARPINPSDILSIRGLYGRKPQLPAVPGYEGAGQIEALGEGVTRWSVGQRVIPVGIDGTWQECLVVAEGNLIATPDSLNDAVAAQLLANPLSANLLLTSILDAKPGDWVVQTAAASALGQLMIQLAKLNGINLINVVRSRHSLEIVKAAGAEHIIISGEENIAARVPEITGKVPVTKAVDAVGGALTGAVAEALGYGATLVVYGSLSMEPISLDSSRLIFRDLTLKGFWLSDWFRSTPREKREAALSEVTKLVASGRLKPAVEGEYDLADFAGAIAHAERQGRGGKIILIG